MGPGQIWSISAHKNKQRPCVASQMLVRRLHLLQMTAGDPPPPLWHSFAAGATSGLAARIVTFPADTIKARLQIRGAVTTDAGAYRSTATAAAHILRTEGPAGFFRGFGAILWGVVPANLAYFGGESCERPGITRNFGQCVCGIIAELQSSQVPPRVLHQMECIVTLPSAQTSTQT